MKRMTVAALGATSSIVRWVLRAAMFCTGLLAMLALVIVLVSLMLAMIVATATPTYAASAAHDLRKRFAHRFHLPPSPEPTAGEWCSRQPSVAATVPRARESGGKGGECQT